MLRFVAFLLALLLLEALLSCRGPDFTGTALEKDRLTSSRTFSIDGQPDPALYIWNMRPIPFDELKSLVSDRLMEKGYQQAPHQEADVRIVLTTFTEEPTPALGSRSWRCLIDPPRGSFGPGVPKFHTRSIRSREWRMNPRWRGSSISCHLISGSTTPHPTPCRSIDTEPSPAWTRTPSYAHSAIALPAPRRALHLRLRGACRGTTDGPSDGRN